MNNWGNKFLAITLVFASLVIGKEQPLHLIHLDFNRTINCIHQDSNDYLWFGTDDGLYKYNGNEYTSFKIDPYASNSISDDNITGICEDKNGVLLIGTNFGGLNTYNTKSDKFNYFSNSDFSDIEITAISNFASHTVFGSSDGLFLLTQKDNELAAKPILENQKITDVEFIDDNTLITSTEDNGFFLIKNFIDDEADREHYLDNKTVNFLFPIKKNMILLSTNSGFYYFNTTSKILNPIDQSRFSEKVYSLDKNAITMDLSGNIWLGSGYKLFKVSSIDEYESIEVESYDLDIANKFSRGINMLYFDRSGVLWINFKGKGLYKYYPARKFSHFNVEHGLMSNVIFSVIENNSHSVLLGTHHGIFVYDLHDHSVGRIPGTEALNFQVISAMFKDNFQNLWCGTNNGLYMLSSDGKLVHYQHSSTELSSISSNFISSIAGDPMTIGDIWVGTGDGLNRYRREYDNFIHYFADQNDANSIIGNDISHIFFSKKNDLWIGTVNTGLSKLNGIDLNNYQPKFTNFINDFDNDQSISDSKVTYIAEDVNQTIWIGTENGGLNSIDTSGRFDHLLETNGLLDNYILSIIPTPDKFLWISTRDGIAKIDAENFVSKNYHFKDGIKKGEFLDRSACITKNGNIFFGSKAGFTIFHPDEIFNNVNPATPQVCGVYVFNEKLSNDLICCNDDYIKLKYNQNVLSFDICALHYVSPTENKISYYLEGIDETWSNCRNFEYLTYSNIKPGKYTFHIKAANNDNIWNENEKVIKFHIETPFWKTVWFQLLVISIICGTFYLFIRKRLSEIDKRKINLEKQISDKIKINSELNHALLEVEALKNNIENENTYLKKEIEVTSTGNYKEIVTSSKNMNHILSQVDIASGADPTILILGESGTGKDLLAHAIYKSSNRNAEAFIKVDCAALPPNLIESELFGHEKGAFTSANKLKIGRFELANGGTIFLDEIGELPIKVQQKLLRVLQSGEFERLGNSVTLKTNTRIIAATNRNLEEEVKNGQFREDLYYRLNVFPINIPPLRERMEDVPLLVQHFINKYADKFNKNITKIPQKTINSLMSYSWPGNIRELENIIQRSIIISRDEILELGDWFKNDKVKTIDADDNIFVSLEEIQKRHIEKILDYTNGKVSGDNGAAEILKINPKTLFSRMKKLNINN